jgi:hypothetical protein
MEGFEMGLCGSGLVSTVINLWAPQNTQNLLTNSATTHWFVKGHCAPLCYLLRSETIMHFKSPRNINLISKSVTEEL